MNYCETYRPLAKGLAWKVYRRVRAAGAQVGIEDVIQEAYVGLLLAQRSFDPSRGAKPITHAYRVTLNHLNAWADRECYRAQWESADESVGLDWDESDNSPERLCERESQLRGFRSQLTQPASRLLDRWLNADAYLRRALNNAEHRCPLLVISEQSGLDAPRSAIQRARREIYQKAGVV